MATFDVDFRDPNHHLYYLQNRCRANNTFNLYCENCYLLPKCVNLSNLMLEYGQRRKKTHL